MYEEKSKVAANKADIRIKLSVLATWGSLFRGGNGAPFHRTVAVPWRGMCVGCRCVYTLCLHVKINLVGRASSGKLFYRAILTAENTVPKTYGMNKERSRICVAEYAGKIISKEIQRR